MLNKVFYVPVLQWCNPESFSVPFCCSKELLLYQTKKTRVKPKVVPENQKTLGETTNIVKNTKNTTEKQKKTKNKKRSDNYGRRGGLHF